MTFDRCACCNVPMHPEYESRALVVDPEANPVVYCTGCWPDIQDAIKTQVNLMSASLY